MLSKLISLFPTVSAVKKSSPITVGKFIADLGNGRWQAGVDDVRKLVAPYENAVREYGIESMRAKEAKRILDAAKLRLPCVTLAGSFEDRRKDSQPVSMSGFVAVDLDGLSDPDDARRRLQRSAHIFALWRSCSGRGLWLLVPVTPEPTADGYSAAWTSAANHCARLLGIAPDATGILGKTIFDPTLKSVSHLCFVSHDPALWLNEAASGVAGEEHVKDSSEHTEPEPCSLCSTPSEPCALGTALGSADDVLAALDADLRVKERFKALPESVCTAYRRHFHEHVRLAPNTRNQTLTKAAPALVRRMGFDLALAVLMAFYDLHCEIWNDSRGKHEYEATEALTNAISLLVSTLPDNEPKIYERLSTEARRAAFRIMRDLARRNDGGVANAFFLSESELAGRVGLSGASARELLQDFTRFGIVRVIERGERRVRGGKRRATRWEWRLTVEATQT